MEEKKYNQLIMEERKRKSIYGRKKENELKARLVLSPVLGGLRS
jgi:hypothetical protein